MQLRYVLCCSVIQSLVSNHAIRFCILKKNHTICISHSGAALNSIRLGGLFFMNSILILFTRFCSPSHLSWFSCFTPQLLPFHGVCMRRLFWRRNMDLTSRYGDFILSHTCQLFKFTWNSSDWYINLFVQSFWFIIFVYEWMIDGKSSACACPIRQFSQYM